MFIKTAILNFMPIGVGVGSAVGGTIVIVKSGMGFKGSSSASSVEEPKRNTISDDEFHLVLPKENPAEDLTITDIETLIAEANRKNELDKKLKLDQARIDLQKEGNKNDKKQTVEVPPVEGPSSEPDKKSEKSGGGTDGSGQNTPGDSALSGGVDAGGVGAVEGGAGTVSNPQQEECTPEGEDACCVEGKIKSGSDCVDKNSESEPQTGQEGQNTNPSPPLGTEQPAQGPSSDGTGAAGGDSGTAANSGAGSTGSSGSSKSTTVSQDLLSKLGTVVDGAKNFASSLWPFS